MNKYLEEIAASYRVPKGFGANLMKARKQTAVGQKHIGQKSQEFINESKRIHEQKFGTKSPGLKMQKVVPETKKTAFNTNMDKVKYGIAGVVGTGLIGNGIY